MAENGLVYTTYRFYIGGVEQTSVTPIIVPEEEKDLMNADLAAFGMSGRWKRKVDVEYAKEILSD
ncbi:MAG: hypothetical protein KAJ73_05235 [Zetaproteobacteria bacterium]|nr:hypothetical protein [Zetaproteobacteria bacterium]